VLVFLVVAVLFIFFYRVLVILLATALAIAALWIAFIALFAIMPATIVWTIVSILAALIIFGKILQWCGRG
jgi:hypothetical protein